MPTANDYICDLAPYQAGLPIEAVARKYGLAPERVIKLASNENPLGPGPKALRAVRASIKDSNRYPEQYALVQALAAKLGVAADMLVVGNGSNDVLDLIARTYLGRGDEAVTAQYAFAMYHIAIQSVGATDRVVPAKNYGHDLEAMRAAISPATKVTWIANPNNPTGTFIPYNEIKEFVAKVPERVIIVLDEAYYDYLDEHDRIDSTRWIRSHPNVIIVRTFSKIYGLAGLRVGYGIASPKVAELLNRVRLPFTSSNVAITAATAALQDHAFLTESRLANRQGREQLLEGLADLGVECLPAFGNFVTFRVQDAAGVNEALLRSGIIVRPLAGYGMVQWLRVTVGLAAENKRFLQAVAQAISVS